MTMILSLLLVDVVRYMRTPRVLIVNAILSEPEFDKRCLNHLSDRGWTSLMHAVCSGFPEVVKLLLDAGADPNVGRDPEGRTAIMIAAQKGNTEVIKLLIEAGADLAVVDRRKRSLLYYNKTPNLEFGKAIRKALIHRNIRIDG